MGASKYEKSLDNRIAALVSREGRAPRAGQDCKPCMVNGLQLVSRLSNARGAHVSRTAREDERAAQAHAAKWHRTRLRDSNLKASRERHSPKTRMSLDVSKCHTWDIILGGRDQEQETGKTQTNVAQSHTCDIARHMHKLIWWNRLHLKLQPNVSHFREKRVILCHFETGGVASTLSDPCPELRRTGPFPRGCSPYNRP